MLPGLCGTYVHVALDFAMARNKQPVQFRKNGYLHDQTVTFIIVVWVCYIAQLPGRPQPDTKKAQKILLYLLHRKASVAGSWRKRQQMFSSSSTFKIIGADLKQWVFGDPPANDQEERARAVRVRSNYSFLFFFNPKKKPKKLNPNTCIHR